MAGYRNYSDDDKAEILAYYDACNNQRMTARDYKIPLRTLQSWIAQRDNAAPSAPDESSVDEKRQNIADKLEALIHKMVDAAPDKINGAQLAATLTSVGIAVDKMRILREQATSINEQRAPKTEQERDAKLAEIVERVKLRLVSGGQG